MSKVKSVNTLRRRGQMEGIQRPLRAAVDHQERVVTLEEGQTIDVTTGL